MFEQSYRFNQVAIKQKENVCISRSDVVTESEIIKGIFRPIPLIAANMSSVVNADFCVKLYELGALGVLHRAFRYDFDYIKETKKISDRCPVTAVSIGIKTNDYLLVESLINKGGANCIFVDVAHGFSKQVLKMCRTIKDMYPTVRVVAGNTINPEMFPMFRGWVDAIKVGIGGGSACITANTAGCTKNQFSAVYDCKLNSREYNIPIISDGSIREPADFTKAIGAGASSVMAGSIFARCPESAAEVIDVGGIKKKVYKGMASRSVQEQWLGKVNNDCPEGKTNLLDLGESVENLLARYNGALRSGISYAGFKNIDDFRKHCEFLLI